MDNNPESEEQLLIEAAFKRSTVLNRSPISGTGSLPDLTKENALVESEDVTMLSTPTRPSRSEEENNTELAQRRVDSELSKMRSVLQKLKLAVENQETCQVEINIIQELSESVEVIDSMQNVWKNSMKKLENRFREVKTRFKTPLKRKFEENSPNMEESQNSKRSVSAFHSLQGGPKETKILSAEDEMEWTDVVRRSKGRKQNPAEGGPSQISAVPSDSQKSKKNNKTRSKPDALLIKAGGRSYADVLGAIRKNGNSGDSSTIIRRIRPTKTGEVLLELERDAKEKLCLKNKLETLLGEGVTVKSLENKETLEFRDLDSLTTVEEVESAIKRDLPAYTGEFKVRVTRENRIGLKAAYVELPKSAAYRLLKNKFIKIGWVRCIIKKNVSAVRCYRCHGYNHISTACPGPDRSKLCYRCGGADHYAKDCQGTAECMLCKEAGKQGNELQHVLGSRDCAVHRDALKEARKASE